MAKVPFPVAIGRNKDSNPAVVMPVDPDSDDSDKEHPVQEPQFVFHAVDDERRRGRPALLPIHHRRPWAVADHEREERLRFFMLMPQAMLCSSTLIFAGFMIYVVNNSELRGHPDFNPDLFVTVFSALVMFFSLVSLLLSHLGVYYYHG